MAKKRYTLDQNRWDAPVEHGMPEGTRVPAEFWVGGVRVAPATVLAPMAGVTDTVFRRFIKNASVFSGEGEGQVTATARANAGVLRSAQDDDQERATAKANATANAGVLRFAQDDGGERATARATANAGVLRSAQDDDQERATANAGVLRSAQDDDRKQAMAIATATADAGGVEGERSNQQSGCGLIMTEFTSADGLSRMRESKRKRYLTYYEDEHPISAQLFGSNPETMADSARIIEDCGFDAVDLNLGCPAKRVVACNGGSGLLKDLPAIRGIFERVRAAVRIPFTVKFRMGWNDQHIVCVELARMAEDCGLNAVALHARTREDGYTGQARWEWIAAVKDAVGIPVIGNGDIRTPEDAAAMVDRTGCDAVMIGRTAPANPWIFRQIAQYTVTGRYDVPTDMDRYRMIRTYFEMLVAEVTADERAAGSVLGGTPNKSTEREAMGKMKQFASWFTHGVPGGAGLRRSIFEAKTGVEVLGAVEGFFAGRAETGEPAPEVGVETGFREEVVSWG